MRGPLNKSEGGAERWSRREREAARRKTANLTHGDNRQGGGRGARGEGASPIKRRSLRRGANGNLLAARKSSRTKDRVIARRD